MDHWFDKIPLNDSTDAIIEAIKNLTADSSFGIYTDDMGNLIFHKKGRGDKILVPVFAPREELCITSVDKKCAEFKTNTKLNDKYLPEAEVIYKNTPVGIIRNKSNKSGKKYIELFEENCVPKGSLAYLKSDIECKVDKLYGRNIKLQILLNIVIKLVDIISGGDKDIYFTLSFSENSAKSVISTYNPDYIYTIFCAETADNFELSKGCAVVYKDSSAVIEPDVREIYQKAAEDIMHQIYFGDSKSLTELYGILVSGARVGALAIPIKHMNSGCEISGITDMDTAVKIFENLLK